MNIQWAKIGIGDSVHRAHIYFCIDSIIWDFGVYDIFKLNSLDPQEFENGRYVDISLAEALKELLKRNGGEFPLLKHGFKYGTRQ